MAKMTLRLFDQLNPQRSRGEHRQMLTLHFSLDFICAGSTSARLFCLPNMRITSHLFIYQGANQLRCDSRAAGSAAGSAADPHGHNMPSIQPYSTHRCICKQGAAIEQNTTTWLFLSRMMPPDHFALSFFRPVAEITHSLGTKKMQQTFSQWKWGRRHPSRPNPDKSRSFSSNSCCFILSEASASRSPSNQIKGLSSQWKPSFLHQLCFFTARCLLWVFFFFLSR